MAEMDDVLSGETIESAWGNQIRDRTLQRYVNVTERDTLNPTPDAGDLAYITSINGIQFYDGVAWVVVLTPEVRNSDAITAAVNTTGSGYINALTANLTIPGAWVSWDIEASASGAYSGTSTDLTVRLTLDGTAFVSAAIDCASGLIQQGAWVARKAGATATGTVALDIRDAGLGDAVAFRNATLITRAVRVS